MNKWQVAAAARASTEERKVALPQVAELSEPKKVVRYIDMLAPPEEEEEAPVVDEFAQQVLAASARADERASSASRAAAAESQAMATTQAAVQKTHAELKDYQERHSRALDALKLKACMEIVQQVRR